MERRARRRRRVLKIWTFRSDGLADGLLLIVAFEERGVHTRWRYSSHR